MFKAKKMFGVGKAEPVFFPEPIFSQEIALPNDYRGSLIMPDNVQQVATQEPFSNVEKIKTRVVKEMDGTIFVHEQCLQSGFNRKQSIHKDHLRYIPPERRNRIEKALMEPWMVHYAPNSDYPMTKTEALQRQNWHGVMGHH